MIHSLGTRVREARRARRLTQEDLAHLAGVRAGTVFRTETDKSVPRAESLAAIANVLGVSVDWLLTGKGDGPDVHAPRVTEAAAVREVAAR